MKQPYIEFFVSRLFALQEREVFPEKIKVTERMYKILVDEHRYVVDSVPETIMGIPIEVDDSIDGEYTFVLPKYII